MMLRPFSFLVASSVAMLLASVPAAAQAPQQVPTVEFTVEVLGTTLTAFTSKMDAYATLRRSLQEGLRELRVTDRPAEILEAERSLATRIRRARAGASRNDIFTPDVRRAFKQILRKAANSGTCEAIADDNPGEFGWDVNDEYPKNKPLSTVPPAILSVLPALPDDISYRFLGRDLILHDSRANIILDRIDDAVPCDRYPGGR
jgi:hypothetical protein